MRSNHFFKRRILKISKILVISLSLVGCSSQMNTASSTNQNKNSNQTNTGTQNTNTPSSLVQPPWYKEPTSQDINNAKAEKVSEVNFTQGPNGEQAFSANDIKITDSELQKIKDGHFTAALAMGYMGSSWPELQLAGLKTEFARLGIKVITVTNADFKDSQEITDLETISARKPNIVVSLPVNPSTETNAYKKLADDGTKIVFMNQPADNMVAGKDYVSVVAPDDFGNGMDAADELAKALKGKGDVLALYYQSNFLTTNLRYQGFVTRLKVKYPNIHLIAATGFNDPNQTQGVASALLTKYPNAKGIWVAWDVPAEGAVAAAQTVGKQPGKFFIVTEDLSSDSALKVAQNSFIYGLGAQRPYDAGVAEAREAALSLIGGNTHPLVAIPNFAVGRDNLAQAYKTVMHEQPSSDILNALK